ncbi:hypothetical protein PoB_005531500 [Plakobranchus ocellatus]|uniref:Uncharacterized protein n=1 Tax=Plakobranchus ocellatus TaxID=259542 RepID=A0AAV4C7W7_9GAST|nr:hypothetical protein PoB_005531500 [Plakobranchus ocellatus]
MTEDVLLNVPVHLPAASELVQSMSLAANFTACPPASLPLALSNLSSHFLCSQGCIKMTLDELLTHQYGLLVCLAPASSQPTKTSTTILIIIITSTTYKDNHHHPHHQHHH